MVCHRILLESKIEINVGAPKAICLETIRDFAEAEGKYIRQTGGNGNYAHVKITLEPIETGSGVEFTNAIKNGAVPKKYIKPVEEGIRKASLKGVLAGLETVDFKVTLYSGSYHDVDSNDEAFRFAGSIAFKEAAQKANPVLLEPVMAFEANIPDERADAIISEIRSRRGTITGTEQRAGSQVIKAVVPLADMLGSAKRIRLAKLGAAQYSTRHLGYLERPSYGDSADNDAGIPVNNPAGPKPRQGSAADDLEFE